MGWQNDAHGLLFKSNEIKLFYSGRQTWAMKLGQLARTKGRVRIITYSLPEMTYIKNLFNKRPENIFMICHSKFKQQAQEIKDQFPKIGIAVCDHVHSKICLISPATLYIGSANFGRSHWHETVIGIRSLEAHKAYLMHSYRPLWVSSEKLVTRRR